MLVSKKELINLKLKSINSSDLRELAKSVNVSTKGNVNDLIKKIISIIEEKIPEEKIDEFIKNKYQNRVNERRKIISDEELIQELMKVKEFKWGVVQGQLDQKIQVEYVRQFPKYDDL
ncbi:MAG: hypothetical protein CH6_2995 [Candidatus Kapaibacterium sp.]|nr:MAG: hypothetical protein CH6_2995 [Candidatus Kapabacteria bacterium]